jgi:hypothetical protein
VMVIANPFLEIILWTIDVDRSFGPGLSSSYLAEDSSVLVRCITIRMTEGRIENYSSRSRKAVPAEVSVLRASLELKRLAVTNGRDEGVNE